MVAPRGRVKLPTLRETPILWVTHLRVSGRVAEDEAVENAVSRAGDIALKWQTGLIFPKILSNKGEPRDYEAEVQSTQ